MSAASDTIARVAWRFVPARLARKLHTEAGKRFMRFVPVSVAAVVTSQIVLAILTGPLNWGGFTSGVLASMTAAAVSYVLSRWAWERKGKPDLLRETLPFWAVSIAVWIILGLTTHYANSWAKSMDIQHWERHLVVNGAYLVMNCLTFVCRFLIFHYALFNDPRPRGAHAAPRPHATRARAVNGVAHPDADRFADDLNGSHARLDDDAPTHPRVPG